MTGLKPPMPGIGPATSDDSNGDRCGFTTAVDGYGHRCKADAVYHVLTVDKAEYGYGLIATFDCVLHLPIGVIAGRLISAHVMGPACAQAEITYPELIINGCIPPFIPYEDLS